MSNPILKVFATLYGAGTSLRNSAYQKGWSKSFAFDFPLIGVGNLSVGGTGKTPCVAWLADFLLQTHAVGCLSRGYGRKTSGYLMGTSLSRTEDIGDEMKLLKQKFPALEIAVSEQRVPAIPAMLEDEESLEVILLDDCFQHRAIKPGLMILLTTWDQPYTRDELLPAGRLRESAQGAERADIIIVTKCPEGLTQAQKEEMQRELSPASHQTLFFSSLKYGLPYPLSNAQSGAIPASAPVMLVTGIANADPMLEYVKARWQNLEHVRYPDHFRYAPLDFDKMRTWVEAQSEPAYILTTEKDAVKMNEWPEIIESLPLYALPVEMNLNASDSENLKAKVSAFIEAFAQAG